MQRRSLIALAIALILGLLAVYLANVFLTGTQRNAEQNRQVRIAVAAVPLDYGTEVTTDKIRFASYPASSLPAGTFASAAELFPGGKRRVALRQILVNEPILASKISGAGENASIVALLADGMRAAAVRINDVSGVAGFVQPNDTVDVLITRRPPGGEAAVTDVLLQNIKVLAIDQDTKNPDGTAKVARTATLEVDPLAAQKLALAQDVGTLSLVLRKPGDQQNMPTVETVSMGDLRYGVYGGARYNGALAIGTAAAAATAGGPVRLTVAPIPRRPATRPAAKPARPAGTSVEVIRGTTNTSYEVGRYGN